MLLQWFMLEVIVTLTGVVVMEEIRTAQISDLFLSTTYRTY